MTTIIDTYTLFYFNNFVLDQAYTRVVNVSIIMNIITMTYDGRFRILQAKKIMQMMMIL